MNSARILLLQVRSPTDVMRAHEVECVERRLNGRQASVTTLNIPDAPDEPVSLDGVDLLLLGGSGDFSVHDPRTRPWVDGLRRIVDDALNRGIPGLGICFGHQLLGLHLGAKIQTDPDCAEVGTVQVHLTEAGRADWLFSELDVTFDVQTGHSDSVVGIPEGVDLLVSNERLDTQAFRVRGTHFYSTQFHPDMTGDEARLRYLAYQEALSNCLPEASVEAGERFRSGADVATPLIGKLVDLVCGNGSTP